MIYNPSKRIMYPKRGGRVNKNLERVLFIDPGLDGTGWAFFNQLFCGSGKDKFRPANHGVFPPKSGIGNWQGCCVDVWSWFTGLVFTMQPKITVIEYPEAWLSSAKGVASLGRGDLGKLFYLVGGMASILQNNKFNMPVLVHPREWKGQLPKEVVIKRVIRAFNIKDINNHEGDALGMGLAAQGGL